MAKNLLIIIVFIIFCVAVFRFVFRSTPTDTINIKIKNKDYTLEVARTFGQKSVGLMNRNSLCPNCGMIFVSSQETPQIFWMKNTLIPLDMIFLDKTGKVINLKSALPQPNTADLNLTLYHSTSPAMFVIELNSGDSQKLNLIPGDQISLPQL